MLPLMLSCLCCCARCCAIGDGSMLALQDMNVLHEQERKLADKPRGWRDYYLATQSDTGVASFWRWLDTFAGKIPAPSPSGPEPSGAYAVLQGTCAACCNWRLMPAVRELPSSGSVEGARISP